MNGDSIASEGKGEYMFVEGRVLSIDGTPIPNATIETWETDDTGEPGREPHPNAILTNDVQDTTMFSTPGVKLRTAEVVSTQTRMVTTGTGLSCLSRTQSLGT